MKSRVRILFAALAAALLLTACETAGPPAPAVAPEEQRLTDLDPRLGSTQTATDAVRKRFDAALRDLRAGRVSQAEERFEDLQKRNPTYRPVNVALAALAIGAEQLDQAQELLDAVLGEEPDYTAANALAAEIAIRRGELERAYTILLPLSQRADAPPAIRRVFGEQRKAWFDDLYARAGAAGNPEEAIALLRQALAVVPEADNARILLVDKLIAARRFNDARRQVEPLVQRSPSSEDVQAALAEIDIGHNRFQDAINRYERLARANPGRFQRRLDEIKQTFVEANMPPQYHAAVASGAITRADLAVLMYWRISAVRFAQNLTQPPIAIDVANVAGRDEFVRALALRLYQVDPITRTAGPDRLVNAGTFLRIAYRLLVLRGTPSCAREASDPDELGRATRALTACGVPISGLAADPDLPVSGRQALAVLQAIDESTEQRQARKPEPEPQQPL